MPVGACYKVPIWIPLTSCQLIATIMRSLILSSLCLLFSNTAYLEHIYRNIKLIKFKVIIVLNVYFSNSCHNLHKLYTQVSAPQWSVCITTTLFSTFRSLIIMRHVVSVSRCFFYPLATPFSAVSAMTPSLRGRATRSPVSTSYLSPSRVHVSATRLSLSHGEYFY